MRSCVRRAIIGPMLPRRWSRAPRPPRLLALAAALFSLLLAACARTPPSNPATFTLPRTTPELNTATPALVVDQTTVPTASACTDGARYLEDLTVPDDSVVAPGAEIDKRWSVQNTGTCDWGQGYGLVHIGGEGLTGPEETALYPAPAGATAVWQVALQAPDVPGEYTSRWQARAPDGTFFGDEVFVIVVVAPAPPTL
jgi:hypothetical protein